jgi:heme a synthase
MDYAFTKTPTHYRFSRPLHLAVWLVALSIFPLVWMGGLVTSHGAGMSVPDWPNSFGYNMFALPWEKWVGQYSGGVFYEHSHRLLGTIAGFAGIIAVSVAFCTRTARWIKLTVTALLLAIIVQGLIGGFRVTEVSLILAKLHGTFGQIVFALAGVCCVICSAWWVTPKTLGA